MFCFGNVNPRFTPTADHTFGGCLAASQFSRVKKHLKRHKYFSHSVSETEAQIFKNKYIEREERKRIKGKETPLTFISK